MMMSVSSEQELEMELPHCIAIPKESTLTGINEVVDDDSLDKKEEEEEAEEKAKTAVDEEYRQFMTQLVTDMAIELANRSIWSTDDMRGRIKKAIGGELPKATTAFPFRIWLFMLWLSGYALSFGFFASCLVSAYRDLVSLGHMEAVVMLNMALITGFGVVSFGLLNPIISWSWEAALQFRSTVFILVCVSFAPIPFAYYFKGSTWVWYRLDVVMLFLVMLSFSIIAARAKKMYISQGLMKPFRLIREVLQSSLQMANGRRESTVLRQNQASLPLFLLYPLTLSLTILIQSNACRPMNQPGLVRR